MTNVINVDYLLINNKILINIKKNPYGNSKYPKN